jgi:dolichyl-diphosphooligosaccharide--protein glycosyltransferase
MSDSPDDTAGPDPDRLFDWVEANYHTVVVGALVAFMFWIRVRTWDNFVVDGEVLFSGNDPWYHFRQTMYTVDHWPATMPYEVWTYFPYGTAPGQFGTLFDQIAATIALIVGLGDPSAHTVGLVLVVFPALLGALVAIPTYLIGRRIAGRGGGVLAVIVLALSSSPLLSRGLAGSADHHVAEALFQAVAVLGVIVALGVARREKPVFEQFKTRDVEGVRGITGWSMLAGLGLAAYLWVWPFGVLLIAILGVYFLVQLTGEFLRGESPEHTAIAGVLTLGTAGVLLIASIQSVSASPSNFTILQPLLAFGVAGWCAFMALLARAFERRELSIWYYPVTVAGTVVVVLALTAVVLPDVFSTFTTNLDRVFGYLTGVSEAVGTIAEATGLLAPNRDPIGELFSWFGLAIYLAGFAVLVILGKLFSGRAYRPELFFLVLWSLFLLSMTFTQARFAYYLAVPVAVLTAYSVHWLVELFDFRVDLRSPEFYQVVTILVLIGVVVVPLLLVTPATAVDRGNQPGDGIQGWSESLEWMTENTPEEGTFGGADNEMAYYGEYDVTDDYDYPAGSYGVMSWWDYGHWITVQGERIPNANPFQQGTQTAANFLIAPNESQANAVLDSVDEDDARTRYVMVDWQMVEPETRVNGKFFAPPEFYEYEEVSLNDYSFSLFHTVRSPGGGQQLQSYRLRNQRYYNTTVNRLYNYHGSSVSPQPIVVDWSFQSAGGRQLPMTPPQDSANGRTIKIFDSMSQARDYVANDSTGTAQIGGIGHLPSERVPALSNYRLVATSEMSATDDSRDRYNVARLRAANGVGVDLGRVQSESDCSSGVYSRGLCLGDRGYDLTHQTDPQWTKVFERVPGAEIRGSGPANGTVRATVEMNNPATDETFNYTQIAETNAAGEFTMTVPYSTEGYDEYGPENGRTNVAVRATGEYEFTALAANGTTDVQVWNGTAAVPESAVIGESDEPISVEMSEVDIAPPADGGQSGEGGSQGSEGTDGTTDERRSPDDDLASSSTRIATGP